MEDAGIIQGYTVEIDREALGLPLLAYIRLDVQWKQLSFLPEVRKVGGAGAGMPSPDGWGCVSVEGDDGLDRRIGEVRGEAFAIWRSNYEHCAVFASGEERIAGERVMRFDDSLDARTVS